MKQNRLKSKIVWAAVAAQVIVILLVTKAVTTDQIHIIEVVIGAVLEILTTVGILNNPTDKEKF